MLTVVAQNWEMLANSANYLDSMAVMPGVSFLYRGQANADWGLQPSLLRHLRRLNLSEEKALEVERHSGDLFRSQAHHHIAPNEFTTTTDIVSWWSLMQHHGAPTRLLDWTASVFVAAYFAVESEPDVDGAITAVHIDSVFAKQGRTPIPQYANDMEDMFTKPSATSSIHFLQRKSLSERMIAQQGGFSLCRNLLDDHGDVISRCLGEDSDKLFYKMVIPARLKLDFLRRLRTMNVTARALFPGLDGLARSVAETVRLFASKPTIA